jgi:hypothetical protein
MSTPDSGDPLANRKAREARRRAWINRFGKQQRRLRKWISVLDLADWCALSTTTAGAVEQGRAPDLALGLLADSILTGEFEHEGRSKILYLWSRITGLGSVPCRLTKEAFAQQRQYAVAMTPAEPLPMEVLARCWVPRWLARRWTEAHGYRWPSHFDPEGQSAALPEATPPLSPLKDAEAAIVDSAPDRAGGKKPVMRRPERQKAFWPEAREVASEWFKENGYPVSGDGNQAKLETHIAEWLTDHDREAAPSTIRVHVRSWIDEYKASVSAPE